MGVKPIPEGYHSVSPYLVVNGAAKVIPFLEKVFGGKVKEKMAQPDGTVMHAEVIIGDSIVMLGEPRPGQTLMPGMLHVYVADVDAAYQRALDAGATTVMPLTNQFYGDRSGLVKDPCGNMWWIATHVEDVPPEEMEKRAIAAMKQQSGG
jgi:PhnB protein